MTDQNSKFRAILTAVGEAKQANASALGIPWKITSLGVGDANGTDPQPDRLQTRLVNEQRRAPLNQLSIDPANASVIVAEQVIPENVGGWWIREIGLYDEDNDLVAVANCAPSYKPLLSQGSGRTQVVRMNLIVSGEVNVELKIDPSIVLATRAFVELLLKNYAPLRSPRFVGQPQAPTPDRFSEDESLATTKFVQQSLGSYAGQTNYDGNTELTVSDIGKLSIFTGSGTAVLPDWKSVPPGALIYVFTTAPEGVICRVRPDEMLTTSSGVVSSVHLTANSFALFRRLLLGSGWSLDGGDIALKYSPLFAAEIGATSWRRLPGGDLEQWGIYLSLPTGQNTTITLPMAYSQPPSFIGFQFADYSTDLPVGVTPALQVRNATKGSFTVRNLSHASSFFWTTKGRG